MRDPAHHVVAVFVRHPEPGRVKTRLAGAIGVEAATALYAAFVEDLARRLPGSEWSLRWWIAPPDPGFARRFAVDPLDCRVQRGGDLGARIRDAFATARAEAFERCVLIGSDMPVLARETLAEAFARLDDADVVLGPADDGGYYLIGMCAPYDVFTGVTWSTPEVLQETLARVRSLGLRATLLEPGFDVDEVEDLARLAEGLADPAAASALPSTARVLRALGWLPA